MREQILLKGLSARFILTIMCGMVFAYTSIRGSIPSEAIVAILVSVFRDYFGRTDRPKVEATDVKAAVKTIQDGTGG